MRYPDGGGLSARGRVQRERVRLEAARLFEQGVRPARVARRLRVSTKSAYHRWTLARITLLIGRLFHIRYTLRGTSYLLHRIGLSPQVPARRAAERDEAKIATWRTETWAKVRG